MINQFKKTSISLLCSVALLLMAVGVHADNPKQGGDVVMGFAQFPRHLNHGIQSGAVTATPGSQVFASLVEYNENYQPQPYLAKSWEISEDGLTYTFHLVEGATFHDGKPITSEDVAFSFEIVKKNHSFGPSMLGPVDRVETPDPHTAVFKLNKPHPALLLVASPPLLPILPKHVFNEAEHGPIRKNPANLKPIGSGPFKVVEFVAGDHYILERYENFFRPGRPYLDRIIAEKVKDPTAVMIALKQQKFHLGPFSASLRLKQIEDMKKVDHLVVTEDGYDGVGPIYFLECNLRKPQFKDIRVRRALSHAIDRNFVTQKLHRGLSKAATGPITSSLPWYTDDVTIYPYDLEKANQLLDEAGFPRKENGMRFSATISWYPASPDNMVVMGEYLKSQLRKIGLDLELRPPADFGTWIKWISGWEYDLTMNAIYSYGDPMVGVHRLYRCDNIKHVIWTNTAGYCNPELDDIMEKASIEMDTSKRMDLYAKFQQILTKDLALVWTHEGTFSTIYHKDLRGVVGSIWGSMSPMDGIYWKDGQHPQ